MPPTTKQQENSTATYSYTKSGVTVKKQQQYREASKIEVEAR